jgi:hypothetical protein
MIKRNEKGQFLKGTYWQSPKLYWQKDWLINEYIVNNKSANQIAIEQGCKENNILYFLEKFFIKIRTMNEIRTYKHWGLNGQDNPMYNKIGELNPNWKGGVTPYRQIFYASEEWKLVCRKVWKRDNAQCQRCQIKYNEGIPLHIHHIISFSNEDLRADENNLILLCKVCHHWVHSKKNIKRDFLGGELTE